MIYTNTQDKNNSMNLSNLNTKQKKISYENKIFCGTHSTNYLSKFKQLYSCGWNLHGWFGIGNT